MMKCKWIPCSKRLPKRGDDVILYFKDTYHTEKGWEPYIVMPAWRCNVGEEDTPNGAWAIEGRLGGFGWVQPLETGIAWMKLPKPPRKENEHE